MTEVTPKLYMIGLIVENMEASLEFYRHLGLASPERLGSHHVQFTAADVTLFLDDEPVEWDPQFAETPFGSLVEFFLGSEAAVRAKAEEMAALGSEPVRPPYITKYGMCFAMLEDPDGNRILLSGHAAGDFATRSDHSSKRRWSSFRPPSIEAIRALSMSQRTSPSSRRVTAGSHALIYLVVAHWTWCIWITRGAFELHLAAAGPNSQTRYDAFVSPEASSEATAVQVNLFCGDIEKAARFYVALGFPIVFTAPKDGVAEHFEIEVAGTRIGLTSVDAANRIAGLGVVASAAVSSELVFWCDDADRMFQRALDAGATGLAAPRDSPDGRIRYGWVRDPESHQLKFVAPL